MSLALPEKILQGGNLDTLFEELQAAFTEISPLMMGVINKITFIVTLCHHDETEYVDSDLPEGAEVALRFYNPFPEGRVIDSIVFRNKFIKEHVTTEFTLHEPQTSVDGDTDVINEHVIDKIRDFFTINDRACFAKASVTLSSESLSHSRIFVVPKECHEPHYS